MRSSHGSRTMLPHSEAGVLLFALDPPEGPGCSGGAGARWTSADESPLPNIRRKLPAEPVDLINDQGEQELENIGVRAAHRADMRQVCPNLSQT